MFLSKLFFLLHLLASFAYSAEISQAVKEKKLYPMGEKIFTKKCPSLKVNNYKSYDLLLEALQNHHACGTLNTKHSQAIALYLWDQKRVQTKDNLKEIKISKEDKCQVCGMYLHYYPNWVCEIDYPKGEVYKFDGVKDMMRFYFNHVEGITVILVKDYYTLKTIDARDAFFVIGSDVLGPMGNELIPFRDKKSATTFSLDHRGKSPLPFDAISEKMVRAID